VRIKTWEELLATPGVTKINSFTIYGPGSCQFNHSMKYLCGKHIEFKNELVFIDGWTIEPWMVTEIKSHNFKLIYEILNGG
jgi:hypothetical protein